MSRPGWRPAAARRALLPLLVVTSSASGQTGHLSLDAGAAHALPPAGAPGESSSYLLGGVRLAPALPERISLFASIHGGYSLRGGSGDWGSAELGLGTSGALGGGRSAGILAHAEAFAVGGDLPYRALAVRATPELRQALGETAVLRVHGTGGLGRSRVGGDGADPVTTDLWTIGGGLEFRHESGAASLAVGAEAFRGAREADYLSGYLSLSGDAGAVTWNAELRGWDAPEGGEVAATALIAFPLGRSAEARAGGGRYGPDPLLESPAGVGAAGVLSWRAVRFSAAPEPPYVLLHGGSVVRFRLERRGVREVRVAGEFSAWEPLPMSEERPGVWTALVSLPPGLYRFGFVVDGEWFVPSGAPGLAADEWGRESAILVVPGP